MSLNLKMKGLFGDQVIENANLYLRNFMDICLPLETMNISWESIQPRLFPFSLAGEAITWLAGFPQGLISILK